MNFSFGEYKSNVVICSKIPSIESFSNTLIIADENTAWIADNICSSQNVPICILKSGEENKTWEAVEAILSAALKAGLGRDGKFIGVGGGVVGDLAGFASSVYMRGCCLTLVSTTLLAMADASVGGKTGFDFSGIKNLAGTFYPAQEVYMPLESLKTLPQKEWKSGMAELIKTAVLSADDFLDMLAEIAAHAGSDYIKLLDNKLFLNCIEKAVLYKGNIVTEDPKEKGKRMLLNLGHTFGHALEAACGLGSISHGEAVAWGMLQSCALGIELGITPKEKAEKIKKLLFAFGFDTVSPHPLAASSQFINALTNDKKKKNGKLTFIVPDSKSAQIVLLDDNGEKIVNRILKDGLNF